MYIFIFAIMDMDPPSVQFDGYLDRVGPVQALLRRYRADPCGGFL